MLLVQTRLTRPLRPMPARTSQEASPPPPQPSPRPPPPPARFWSAASTISHHHAGMLSEPRVHRLHRGIERGAYVASLESVSDPATITGGVGTRGMPLGTDASPERIERPRWWPAGRRQGQGRKGRRKSNSSSNVRKTSATWPKRSNSSVELRVVDPPSMLPSIRVPLQAAHPRGRCNGN